MRTVAIEAPLELARTLELVGMLHRYLGQYGAAVLPIDRALAIRGRLSPDHPDTIFALQIRGDISPDGRSDRCSAALVFCTQPGRRPFRPDHPEIAAVLRRLGFAAFSLGNLAEARRFENGHCESGNTRWRNAIPRVPALPSLSAFPPKRRRIFQVRKLYRRALTTVQDCLEAGNTGLTADMEATLVNNDAGL